MRHSRLSRGLAHKHDSRLSNFEQKIKYGLHEVSMQTGESIESLEKRFHKAWDKVPEFKRARFKFGISMGTVSAAIVVASTIGGLGPTALAALVPAWSLEGTMDAMSFSKYRKKFGNGSKP